MGSSAVVILSVSSGVVASIAAATAAYMSRTAVERANLAFVWAELFFDRPDAAAPIRRLRIQLHSDGPGIALDVRWSIGGPTEGGRAAHRRAEEEIAAQARPAIRALRPGHSHPSVAPVDVVGPDEIRAHYESTEQTFHDDYDEPWWVLVRWSDSAGRRWQFSESSDGLKLATPRMKVRKVGRRPWWARIIPSWCAYTQPARLIRRQRTVW